MTKWHYKENNLINHNNLIPSSIVSEFDFLRCQKSWCEAISHFNLLEKGRYFYFSSSPPYFASDMDRSFDSLLMPKVCQGKISRIYTLDEDIYVNMNRWELFSCFCVDPTRTFNKPSKKMWHIKGKATSVNTKTYLPSWLVSLVHW